MIVPREYKILLSVSAEEDIQEIETFVAKTFSVVIGRKVRGKILSKIKQLKRFPLMGKLDPFLEDYEGDFRFVMQEKSRIVYQVEEDKIKIHRIWDVRQNPNGLLPETRKRKSPSD